MIHNISIATDDDIMKLGDDVNIYPAYFYRAIIIWENCLNWQGKTIFLSISCKLIWELTECMSFNSIRVNKIIAKISEFTVT